MSPHLPLTDPAFVQNPYPALERLREETPLFFDTALNRTVVLRYDDISGILRDKRFGRTLTHLYSRDELGWPLPDPAQQHFDAFNGNHMLDSEGEKHTRLRSLVGKAFTPRRVETLQPRIEAILEERLSALGPEFDLVADYAEPLPVTVIAELLGVPEAERFQLRPWSAAIVKLYEPQFTRTQQSEAERAVVEFSALIRKLAAERPRRPPRRPDHCAGAGRGRRPDAQRIRADRHLHSAAQCRA
ncbi:hypothetical protein [Deinococcus rubellus]|uniref:hypothetical protein n=1 Tax=Deinococcus rubellus TaxID=1889240 RepID=UPI0028AA66EB|nr:hypothetical protein [Deinococcus rubellus]